MNWVTLRNYISSILSGFFRWWWASLTGVASIVGLFVAPESGLILGRIALSILILVFSVLFFLTVSVLYHGWGIYKNRRGELRIADYVDNPDEGSKGIFLIESAGDLQRGDVLEVRAYDGEVEIGISVAEITNKNTRGQHQCIPLWISSDHQRKLKSGEMSVNQLVGSRFLTTKTVERLRTSGGEQ